MKPLKQLLVLIIASIFSLLVAFYPFSLSSQAQIVLAIIVFAMILWITEAFPLHATALLAVFFLVIFAGFTPDQVFPPFFDPVIALLLGGFVLAVALQKHELDEKITHSIISRIGNSPKKFLFALMCLAAFFSMWMSNTATTAVILPIAVVILKENKLVPLKSNFGKAIVLGIAFAASIGGIGTLIGSTPNPLAVKFLADNGIQVSFLDWMFYGLPIVVLMVPIAFLLLIFLFKPEIKELKISYEKKPLNKNQKIVIIVFVLTILLWLTTKWHGIHVSVVSLFPIIALYLLNKLDVADFSKIEWHALILFGGGLSLGTAMHASGLDLVLAKFIVQMVLGQPLILIFFLVALFGIILTTVSSNTAAAVIFVPIVLPIASMLGVDLKLLAIIVAIAASMDFIVPIGTPPNTMAYSTGFVRTRDMAMAGIPLALIGITLLSLLAFFFW